MLAAFGGVYIYATTWTNDTQNYDHTHACIYATKMWNDVHVKFLIG